MKIKKNKIDNFKFAVITKAIIASLLSLVFSFIFFQYFELQGNIKLIFVFFAIYSFSYIYFYEISYKRYLKLEKFSRFFFTSMFMVLLYAIMYLVMILFSLFFYKLNLTIFLFYITILLITGLYTFSNVYVKELFAKKKGIAFSIIFISSGFIFGLAIGGFINIAYVICNLLEYLINKIQNRKSQTRKMRNK